MKRVIIEGEESSYSKEFMEKERKRAIKEILESDNFVVVYHSKKGGGGAISCISGDHLLPMAYGVDKIGKELNEMVGEIIKKKGKEVLDKMFKDLMKGKSDE